MKKYIYIIPVLALLLAGCNYLEPDNKTAANQSADVFFSEDPSVLRVYAYSKMKEVVKALDLFEDGTDLYVPANKKAATDYDQYTFNPEDAKVKALYSACYSVINYASCCIYYDKDAKYKAEMRWLCDYCYYVLTQQFGAVPYVTHYINDASREYPRKPLLDIYDALIRDLDTLKVSATLSPTDYSGVVSQMACYGLLSKVALAAGWDAERAGKDGSTYFQKSLAAAEKVMEHYGNELPLTSFEEKWSPKNENNVEALFAVQYDRAGWKGDMKTGGHGWQNTYGSYYGDCTSTGLKYSNSYRCLNAKGAYLWEPNDERWNGTFMSTIYNSVKAGWGTEGYYAYYNNTKLDTLGIACAYFPGTATSDQISAYITQHATQLKKGSYVNDVLIVHLTYPEVTFYSNSTTSSQKEQYYTFIGSGPLSGMFTAPSCKKFDDPNTECIALNQTNDYRDIVLINASDIFLNAAEAQMKLGGDYISIINKVRARSGASMITDFASYAPAWKSLTLYQNYTLEPIDLILDERARELFGEGYRWMDLHRTGKLIVYNETFNYYLNGKTPKMYRPIPQAEINANKSMSDDDQNEEWGGKWSNK